MKVIATEYARNNPGQAAEELAIAYQLEAWGVPITIEERLRTAGTTVIRDSINEALAEALNRTWRHEAVEKIRQILPADLIQAETTTFHEAIEGRIKWLEKTGDRNKDGSLSTRTRKCIDRLRYLRDHHENRPLWTLDLAQIEQIAAYWRNRPPTKKGSRCSWTHAYDMNKEFFRLLEWLDTDKAIQWEKPKGCDKVTRSPVKFSEDDNSEPFETISNPTYDPEQLAVLVRHTHALGRAMIGVCVNCAFGASEIGQWPTGRYSLFKPHPHQDKIGFKSSDRDSWIVGRRPKTGVYGEHLLWPEVAAAVRPLLDGREVLPISRTGSPWYRTHSSNPQSKFGNWWSQLLDRVQKKEDKSFPRYSFGTLRDVMPDLLRREYDDQIASLALQHRQISSDDILICYANLPFKRLFNATKGLRERFEPFLSELANGNKSSL